MYTVLYQWDVHHDKHDDFISGWEAITEHYLANHDSLGSKLHKVTDSRFVAIAQWPSKQTRDIAFNLNDAPLDAIEKMKNSIIIALPPTETTVVSDKLKNVTSL